MKKKLILGIGSPFGDDQFGWLVAKEIKQKLTQRTQQSIDIVIADRPGLNLLRFLEMDYQQIVLIDLVSAKAPVGQVFNLSAEEILEFSGFLSSHNIGVAPSIALASALDIPIKNIDFYGVQGERFNVKDDRVSDVVRSSVTAVVQLILNQIKTAK